MIPGALPGVSVLLGHGGGIHILASLMQVESTTHTLKNTALDQGLPSSSWNRRLIYFYWGKGRRDMNGDHSR